MRYFIAFIMTILLIIVLIVMLFHSGSSKPKVPTTSKTLDSYAQSNSEVSFTTDGPVNANLLHQQTRIIVDREDVTFEHIQGYEGNVVKRQQYANTEEAYRVFLLALTHAGFTLGANTPELRDERGHCPLGTRYIVQLKDDEKVIERYWTSTCGSPKTYLGLLTMTQSLFQAQVPDYADQTANIGL